MKRKLVSVQTPPAQPGFLGRGHTARPVIMRGFADSDPFILLMDDVLDKKDDEPVGGPHPHAGFETVSLLLEGEIGDGAHKMQPGDFQMMTAGSGVIHTETIDKKAKMRLLQLWLTLPKASRWASPRLQDLSANDAPTLSKDGLHFKLYSGSLAGLTSPIENYVPVIIADITVDANKSATLPIPASFNTFIYVLEGAAVIGDDERSIGINQVGWLDRYASSEGSELTVKAAGEGVRFVLYAGEPQGEAIVSHGPFIGDTQDDIRRLYHEFHQGKMRHILEMTPA